MTDEFIYPKVHSSFIFTLVSKSVKGHTRQLAKELGIFCKNVSISHLIFLGDSKRAWLYQENEYKPAKDAYNFLAENTVTRRFNGGLKIDCESISTFLYHFIWLTRSNASLPYFYFMDENQNVLGHICQYGNLHIEILNPKFEKRFKEGIQKTNLLLLKGGSCYNQFSKYSRLKGRKISV
ncbi:MAG: hypothetical protein ABI581_11205 [Sediminibacterium sp.]